MELNEIYNIDVLEGLRQIPDNSIDLIVTSPPYNKGYWTKNKSTKDKYYNISKKVRKIDYGVFDDNMSPEDYERWQREVLNECIRVIKPTGSIFYNHKDIYNALNTVHPLYVWDYPVKQLIIWDKGSTPNVGKEYFLPCTEWLFWIKKTPDSKPYFDRKKGKYCRNVWRIIPDKKNSHPAPFPLEIPENCILTCTKENDIVLDPFMGSGTTALAAKKNKRNYIGFELNNEYIEEANKRICRL